MDASAFRADLEAKPEHLRALAEVLDRGDPWSGLPAHAGQLLLLGMGSSYYASSVAAARLRAQGVPAVAELASSDLLPPPSDGTVAVAVSAGGGSRETVAALERYRGRCPVVLLTNAPTGAAADLADLVVPVHAGDEVGGVACRSFQHTLALLLALEDRLCGGRVRAAVLVRAAATATADLLDRRADWLPDVVSALDGPYGVHVVAPARRLSSALQGALMLREGPRIPAVGCETGDWSHVDVYLTKSTDYRLLLLAGSPWEDELLRWTDERASTVVAVGADVPSAQLSVRYAGDEDDDVRLLTEVLVPELVAGSLWADRGQRPG